MGCARGIAQRRYEAKAEARMGISRWQSVAVASTFTFAACNGGTALASISGSAIPPSPAPSTIAPTASGAPDGSARTYRGILGYAVSCLMIDPDDEPPWPSPFRNQYELRLPDGYTRSGPPYEVFGPDGNLVAREGDRIEVVGPPLPQPYTTLCMIGPVLEAIEIRAAADA
jgi:hypothetical protein